jgi:hypothetical protein
MNFAVIFHIFYTSREESPFTVKAPLAITEKANVTGDNDKLGQDKSLGELMDWQTNKASNSRDRASAVHQV